MRVAQELAEQLNVKEGDIGWELYRQFLSAKIAWRDSEHSLFSPPSVACDDWWHRHILYDLKSYCGFADIVIYHKRVMDLASIACMTRNFWAVQNAAWPPTLSIMPAAPDTHDLPYIGLHLVLKLRCSQPFLEGAKFLQLPSRCAPVQDNDNEGDEEEFSGSGNISGSDCS